MEHNRSSSRSHDLQKRGSRQLSRNGSEGFSPNRGSPLAESREFAINGQWPQESSNQIWLKFQERIDEAMTYLFKKNIQDENLQDEVFLKMRELFKEICLDITILLAIVTLLRILAVAYDYKSHQLLLIIRVFALACFTGYLSRCELKYFKNYNAAVFIFQLIFVFIGTACVFAEVNYGHLYLYLCIKCYQMFESLSFLRVELKQFIMFYFHGLYICQYEDDPMWYITAFIFMSLILYSNYQNSRLHNGYLHMLMEKMERTEVLERKWRQSLEQMPNGVLIFTNRSLVVEFMNLYFAKLFGLSHIRQAENTELEELCKDIKVEVKYGGKKEEFTLAQVLQTKALILSSSQYDQQEELKVADELRENFLFKAMECDYQKLQIKGTKRKLQVNSTLFYEAGKEPTTMVIVSDISKISLAEKHEQLDKMKTIYFCSVAHDLKTPINSIQAINTHLEARFKEDYQMQKYTDIIKSSCFFLKRIIDDIMDLSRIELNQFSINVEQFDLKEAIEEVFKIVKISLKFKTLSLYSEFDSSIAEQGYVVCTDKKRLQQILFNLLNNAMKYTFKGYIKLKIDLKEVLFDDSGYTDVLQFQVQDTGVGIKEADVQKLFQLFGKLKLVNKVNQSGIGLGLTICKKLVELLGGIIEVESIYGIGSTFKFTVKSQNSQILLGLSDSLHLDDKLEIYNQDADIKSISSL